MPLCEVSLCNGKLAIDAISKFNPGVSAGKIRTEKFGPVFDVLWDDEVGRLCIRIATQKKEILVKLLKSDW